MSAAYEATTVGWVGRYRIELRIIPYASGMADIRLVQVGPRGGETVLWYVGGPESAKQVRETIRRSQRREQVFLSAIDSFYPREIIGKTAT